MTARSRAPGGGDRLARVAERLLRLAGDPRVGLALLLAAGLGNALAAALPDGPRLLEMPPYAILLGAIVVSGLAGVAVRAPAAWREWRRPAPLREASDTLRAAIPLAAPPDEATAQRLADALRDAGYRVRSGGSATGWWASGTRRGWSRLAALGSHLALVLIVVGAAAGAAFGHETVFSLLPGDQALLDAPRPGFTDAVRLERFDAEFGTDGRPRRLDTTVTFLRDGEPIRRELLQVNRPASFGGYLVHGWTYGPAVEVRVTSLGGQALHDAEVPLDGRRDGRPSGFIDVPAAELGLGLVLLDADANLLGITAGGQAGVIDAAELRPGDEARLGDVIVSLERFSAYVTFLSRTDPGAGLLFVGAGLLTGSLAIAFWLPRRRCSVRWADGALRLLVRGERFDRPETELQHLSASLVAAAGVTP
jgi:cytochrome c biogenesis protein